MKHSRSLYSYTPDKFGIVCLLASLVLLINPAKVTAENNDTSTRPDKVVIAKPVTLQAEQTRIEAIGTSRAKQSVILYPKTSGEVSSISFTTGQKVKKGQTLLQLDDEDIRLAVELAKVHLQDARRLKDRYEKTQGAGTVTPFEMDEAASAVKAAEITLQRNQLALQDHSLIAPFDGHIGLSDVDIGLHITPDTPIVSLDDRSSLYVSFEVPELFFGQVPPGEQLALSPWSAAGQSVAGMVTDVDSRIKPDTRTFTVRASIDNSKDRLRPGMSYRVELNLKGEVYPRIPETALQWGDNGAFTWQLKDGKVYKKPASIVKREPGFILVDADLPANSLVVSEGLHGLREGLSVSLQHADPSQPPRTAEEMP